jgi:transcriptional regulator with XRE-family HTH domain
MSNEWMNNLLPDPNELTEFEKMLQALLASGKLELRRKKQADTPTADHEETHPSEEDQQLKLNAWQKMVEQIGIPTLGTYIRLICQRQGLMKKDVVSQIRIASRTLTEIETDKLGFFDLGVEKAVDLAEVMNLNIHIVTNYLRTTFSPMQPPSEATRLYRFRPDASREEKAETEAGSPLSSDTLEDGKQRIEQFIQDFENEAIRRGLM